MLKKINNKYLSTNDYTLNTIYYETNLLVVIIKFCIEFSVKYRKRVSSW